MTATSVGRRVDRRRQLAAVALSMVLLVSGCAAGRVSGGEEGGPAEDGGGGNGAGGGNGGGGSGAAGSGAGGGSGGSGAGGGAPGTDAPATDAGAADAPPDTGPLGSDGPPPGAMGTRCSHGGECTGGFCVDGVCCETVCDAPCRSCSRPGKEGKCAPMSGGTDAPCTAIHGTDAVCSATGRCGRRNGVACGGTAECASGFCEDGVCCTTFCSLACRACNSPGALGECIRITSGTDPPKCQAPAMCAALGFCVRPDGSACVTDSDCVSGHCVSSVCCPTSMKCA